MKKSLIIASLAVFLFSGICQAKTTDTAVQNTVKPPIKAEAEVNSVKTDADNSLTVKEKGLPPKFDENKEPKGMQPPPEFNGSNPVDMHRHPGAMQQQRHGFHQLSKEEMDAKKAEFEKRLKLTEKQKKQIEQNRIKDHEAVKPLMDKMKEKQHELGRIENDNSLSREEKGKITHKLRGELRALRMQADNQRKANMKNFESVLTKKQQKEFAKIKKEQKKDMEKRRKHFEKQMKQDAKHGMFAPPFDGMRGSDGFKPPKKHDEFLAPPPPGNAPQGGVNPIGVKNEPASKQKAVTEIKK